MKKQAYTGFTLAELLIALSILGVIATFTIPRLLVTVDTSRSTAIAKDMASMVAGSFSSHQISNSIGASTTGADLTQYMNYVSVDTTSSIAGASGTPLQTCSATLPCLRLHNGGILQYDTAMATGGTTPTNGLYFNIDPDGDGPQGRMTFVQFANGRLSTGELAGTATPSGGTLEREATDPTYLQSWN